LSRKGNLGNVTGAQMAGFANYAGKNFKGVQIAGFLNVAVGNIKGAQFAGFANFARGYQSGTQIAGFMNVATDSVVNGQVSGFVNIAKNVKGTQIGFLNLADSISGIPVGFLSIVRHGGYQKFEVEANETFFLNMNAKIGVSKLYNIFTVGVKPAKDQFIWAWGYGMGSQLFAGEKLSMNLDFTASHVNEGEWFTNRLNLASKLKIHFAYKASDKVTLYGGPSLNTFVRETTDSSGNPIADPKVSPYTMSNWVKNNVETQFYPGFSLGARF